MGVRVCACMWETVVHRVAHKGLVSIPMYKVMPFQAAHVMLELCWWETSTKVVINVCERSCS